MCIPPRVQANVQERTARRSVPAAYPLAGYKVVCPLADKVVCPLAGCVPLLAGPLAGWRRLTK
jgi:hypothetical protein